MVGCALILDECVLGISLIVSGRLSYFVRRRDRVCGALGGLSVKKLSATEAMNLYEAPLRLLPEVSSLHIGFDDDKPMIIITVAEITEELERKIGQVAPDAPIKLLQVRHKKAVTATAAEKKYGAALRSMKPVASVNVGRKGNKDVLVVRAFPLTDGVRTAIHAEAPDAPLDLRASRHHKNSIPSVLESIANKLKAPCAALVTILLLLVVLAPVWTATSDIKFALTATSADGQVVAAERPVMDVRNREDITQDVTVKFMARGQEVTFSETTPLFNILSHFENLNAEPYHKNHIVTVAYQSNNPQGTARIFDRGRFWATILIYLITVLVVALTVIQVRSKWQEW